MTEKNAKDLSKSDFDRFLPVANIGRIIKTNLPKEVKLSKDAKETFQECVTEFISFITSEASEKCKNEKRKTINGDDIIFALNTLGFEHYNPILRIYLQKYRASQKNANEDKSSNIKNDEEQEDNIESSENQEEFKFSDKK